MAPVPRRCGAGAASIALNHWAANADEHSVRASTGSAAPWRSGVQDEVEAAVLGADALLDALFNQSEVGMTVVDAFDAMVTLRPYKDAVSPAEALAELQRCAGSRFDPVVVEAFTSVVGRQQSTARAA